MFKFSAIVLLVSIVYYTQCLPTQTSSDADSQSETVDKLQLFVNNGSEGMSYHLAPVMTDLETEDQQMEAELSAVLPYLNFLMGGINGEGFDDCIDQLEIQLVR